MSGFLALFIIGVFILCLKCAELCIIDAIKDAKDEILAELRKAKE